MEIPPLPTRVPLPAQVMPPLLPEIVPSFVTLPLTDHWVTSVSCHLPPERTVTLPSASLSPPPPHNSTSVPDTMVLPATLIGEHEGSYCVPPPIMRLPPMLIAAPSWIFAVPLNVRSPPMIIAALL